MRALATVPTPLAWPGRPPSAAHVARVAPPPAPKESRDEGWLRLTWSDATQLFDAGGFELVQADLSSTDPARFDLKPGWNALVNAKEPLLAPFASKASFGRSPKDDCDDLAPSTGARSSTA